MTDLQKELVDELKGYALRYLNMASDLSERLDCIAEMLQGEDEIDPDFCTLYIQLWGNQRQRYLEKHNPIQTLKDEREAWKALSVALETEPEEES